MGMTTPDRTQAQGARTNTDFALELIASKADSLLAANAQPSLTLVFEAPRPVRLRLVDDLIKRGYRVHDSIADSLPSIRLLVDPQIRFRYEKLDRKTALRGADGTISLELKRGDGQILAAQVLYVNFEERVTQRTDELDDGLWPMASFASIEKKTRKRGVERILEPSLIITAVSVTIFLLFNVRSQ